MNLSNMVEGFQSSCIISKFLLFYLHTCSPQIVDLALILKDPVPSKAEDADEEFAGDRWDSEEQKEEEEDPFWK